MSVSSGDGSSCIYNGKLPMATQDVIEALFRYDLLQKEAAIEDPQSLLTMHHLMELFLAAEKKLEDAKSNQHQEMNEVQKYVDNVRTLSEERDKLTVEFEQENEKLKLELEQLHNQSDDEKAEVNDMCKQEGLDELVGSSFSEQMAYLLVVRATLMDKVEVLQEQLQDSNRQCANLTEQINNLVSEESELGQRMTSAMCEMGGMASKLTEALQERDKLLNEVADLKGALEGIQTLPVVKEAQAESATHLADLEHQRQFYQQETEKLRHEVEEAKQEEQSSRLELTTQIEELQEMNENLKAVNKKLNEQLDLTGIDSNDFEKERKGVVSHSQKIIQEMQSALEADEAKSKAQQMEYDRELQAMRTRITQLENDKNNADSSHGNGELVSELRAQLAEARSEHERRCDELAKLKEKLSSAQRDVALRDVADSSWKEQHATQARLTGELQERNVKLENELTKVWTQLKDALEKLNCSERERSTLELRIKERETESDAFKTHESDREEVKRLKEKMREMENKLFSETSGTTSNNKMAELQTRLRLCEDEKEEEAQLRLGLVDDLQKSREALSKAKGKEDELRNSVLDLQKRALNAEAQVLLVSGEKNQQATEKLVAELNRNQLEDAVELMRARMELFASQSRSYADRYKNLKLKHKSKIRRIRELFVLERKATAEELESLEQRLASAEEALSSELSWKEDAARDVRSSEEERRRAISATDETRRKLEESIERIHHLSSANNDLDSKNSTLATQLRMLEKQKQELHKMIETAQRTQQKEELQTLLSTLSMSGSLPHMGKDSSSFTSNDPDTSPIRKFMTLDTSDALARSGEIPMGDQRHPSSYLNLTDTGNARPAKRVT